MALNFITNRYVWVTLSSCRRTKSTTKDVFCDSAIVNIYCRIIDLTVSRSIFCLVTTAIDIVINRTAIDYDSNCILWSTIEIVTTKYVVNNTTFNSYCNRTKDVCSDF